MDNPEHTDVAALTAAAALGIRLSVTEMQLVQEAHQPGECVELLRSYLESAAGHPDLHPALIENLLQHPDRDVVLSAAFHPSRPLSRRNAVTSKKEYNYPLSNPSWMPPHMLRVFATDPDDTIRAKVAKSSRLPTDLYEALAADESPTVRVGVASHKKLPEHLVRMLARDINLDVRNAVANCAAVIPTDALEELVSKVDAPRLAANPAVPADTLRKLAAIIPLRRGWEYEPPERREAKRSLISALAGNPNLPIDLLVMIADGVAGGERASDTASPSRPKLRTELAANQGLDTALLERLSADDDAEVRQTVARNKAMTGSLLERMSHDEDTATIGAVLRNPNVPHSVRERLIDDPRDFRRTIYANKNTPGNMLAVLAESYADTEDSAELYALSEILIHPSTPQQVVDGFATHSLARIREAVAWSTVTSDEVRERLADDANPTVRKKAVESQVQPLFMEFWLEKD